MQTEPTLRQLVTQLIPLIVPYSDDTRVLLKQIANVLEELGDPLILTLDYTAASKTNPNEEDTYLTLHFPENGEHFSTGEVHPSYELGLRAAERVLKRHNFVFMDLIKIRKENGTEGK